MKVDAFLSPADLQALLNITRPTEIKWRKAGILPKPMVLARRVYYRRADIEKLTNTLVTR